MALKQKIPCPKCDGRGIIPQYFYNRKGICFLCWGAKYIMIKVPGGKTLEQVQKEMIAKEKPDFKKNPPEVDMPNKDQIKNPSYFPTSNSKVESLEVAVKEKEKEKPAEPEKPKFDFAAYKELDAIQIQEKVMRDYKDSSVKELKEMAAEMYKAQKGEDDEVYRVAAAAAKGFESLIKRKEGYSEAELEAFRQKIRDRYGREMDADHLERHRIRLEAKSEDEDLTLLERQKAKAEAEAFVELEDNLKKLNEGIGQQDALIRQAFREQAKNATPAQLVQMKKKLATDAAGEQNLIRRESLFIMADEAQKMYREKAPKRKKPEGVPALPYNDDIFKGYDSSRGREYQRFYEEHFKARKNSLEGMRELKDHYERYVPVKVSDFSYVYQTEIVSLEGNQIKDLRESLGMQRESWGSQDYPAESLRKLLAGFESEEFAENQLVTEALLNKTKRDLAKAEVQETFDNFIEKHLPESKGREWISYHDHTEKQLADALLAALDLPDGEGKDKVIREVQRAVNERAKNSGMDAARAEAAKRNKVIDDKRKEIVSNISYNKDTEIGRKVAEMAAKGVDSPEAAIAIGEVVAARLAENLEELGLDYADYAKKYKAYRDSAVELEALQDEYTKEGKRRFDNRISFEKQMIADKRYKELRQLMDEKVRESQDLRRHTYEYEAKVKQVKEKAYLKTMQEIRGMGGTVAFTKESTKTARGKETIDNLQTVTSAFPKEWIDASNLTEIKLAAVGRDGREYSQSESKWFVRGTNVEMDGGALGLGVGTSRSTHIHELQHRMDGVNPNLNNLMRQFYTKKVTGPKGKAKKPKTIPGYTSREKYIEVADGGNKWVDAYMGKHYGSADTPESTRAWEIGTMAMESIVLDKNYNGKRLEFYQEDVYKFMLGVLAGV